MDPITLSLILKGASGLAQGAFGAASAKRQAEEYGRIAKEGEALIPGLEQKVEQFGVGPTMRKLKQMASEDPIADLARERGRRREGTAVEALKSGGARSLFALPATMTALEDQSRQVDADEFGRRLETLSRVGQAEEAINRAKLQQKMSDLDLARSQAGKYRLAELGAEEGRRQALTSMLTSGLSTAASLAQSGAFNKKETTGEEKSEVQGLLDSLGAMPGKSSGYNIDFGSPETGTFSEATFDEGATNPFARAAELRGRIVRGDLDPNGFSVGEQLDGSGSLESLIESLDPFTLQAILRGRVVRGDGGYQVNAKGGRLPGGFNHKENPIHMVDNNGKKVGEATGDEVVLNKEQQKKIAKESSFFRRLMKLPRFK